MCVCACAYEKQKIQVATVVPSLNLPPPPPLLDLIDSTYPLGLHDALGRLLWHVGPPGILRAVCPASVVPVLVRVRRAIGGTDFNHRNQLSVGVRLLGRLRGAGEAG